MRKAKVVVIFMLLAASYWVFYPISFIAEAEAVCAVNNGAVTVYAADNVTKGEIL